jgi:hypothetical protein
MGGSTKSTLLGGTNSSPLALKTDNARTSTPFEIHGRSHVTEGDLRPKP